MIGLSLAVVGLTPPAGPGLLAREITARATLKGHTAPIMGVAFSPDGKALASGSYDQTIKLWDVTSGKNTATLKDHTGVVWSVAFSPDGKTLASGTEDEKIKLWDLTSHKNTTTLKGHPVSPHPVIPVAFSPDGKTLASGSEDRKIRLWDVLPPPVSEKVAKRIAKLVEQLGSRTFNEREEAAKALDAIGPAALAALRKAAESSDAEVKHRAVYLIQKIGQRSRPAKIFALAQGGPVSCLAFSPDGKTLAAGSYDKTINLWDVTSGKKTRTLEGNTGTGSVHSVAFSPDGKTLASACQDNSGSQDNPPASHGGMIRLWNVSSGQNTATLQDHAGLVWSVAFSPDGKTLASGNHDKTIRLWDVTSGKNTATLKGHTGPVHSVAFSPDGKTLASGSCDSTIKLWDVPGARKAEK
jgi:WD40 repeat protein